MAKFPTTVEKSVTVKTPIARVYAYLWDVAGSSPCVPGIDQCSQVAPDTYRFLFQERSAGPVSMIVRYTAVYQGNGSDRITFRSRGDADDNTDVDGEIRLKAAGDSTKIILKQMLAPDSPVPRLLQGFLTSFVEKEASEAARQYLANVKRALEEV